ncbi:MAG: dienelactone hydrolase family protein [Proteobacteria bacterium]|nr:dienelactone hydrolase family protein [Pseudomonadota bacterium]
MKTIITAKDGAGVFSAYMAIPAKTPAAAIIVIQEIFGVNADMRAKCDSLAAQGYIAIAPDLFWRQEPGVDITDKSEAEWKKAFALFNGFNIDKGVEDLEATLNTVRAIPECNGKVGAVGYCLGGKLAYLMASRTTIDASVSYYGVALDTLLGESGNIKKPLMLHMAELDKFVPSEARERVVNHFKNNTAVSTHVYAGQDHAFARINGEHYNEAAATLANKRTDDFFADFLK